MTIMTPTYNRAYILPKLYESLCSQSDLGFEWVVIDDGSTDNTQELVTQWQNIAPFQIIYKKQPNGGKHRAINEGAKLSNYDWFEILDSDDMLTPTAIERYRYWIKTIEDDDSIAGIFGLSAYISTGKVVGDYPKKYALYIDAPTTHRKRLKLWGDNDNVIRTSILRKYPFPEFEGENFMMESVLYDSISKDGYRFRYINEVTRLVEYLPDGLTSAWKNNCIKNFEGVTLATRICVLAKSDDAAAMLRAYFRYVKMKELPLGDAVKKLSLAPLTVLWVLVVGTMFDCIYRLRRKFGGGASYTID